MPGDGLENRELVTFNVQTEKIDFGSPNCQQNGIKREALDSHHRGIEARYSSLLQCFNCTLYMTMTRIASLWLERYLGKECGN